MFYPGSRLPVSVLDGIATLIDASRQQTEIRPGGAARYRILETIREFALEQLETNGETAAIRHVHAAYFPSLAERYELPTYCRMATGSSSASRPNSIAIARPGTPEG